MMAEITKKDISDTLSQFYGKIIQPEFKETRKKLDGHDQKFRDILDHFDRIYLNVAKQSYNPADRDAGKAFQRPPFYVEDRSPKHITVATFSESACYP